MPASRNAAEHRRFPNAQKRAAWRTQAKRNRRIADSSYHDDGADAERAALIASADALDEVCDFLASVAEEARRG